MKEESIITMLEAIKLQNLQQSEKISEMAAIQNFEREERKRMIKEFEKLSNKVDLLNAFKNWVAGSTFVLGVLIALFKEKAVSILGL